MLVHSVSTSSCFRTEQGYRRAFGVFPPKDQVVITYEEPGKVRAYAGYRADVPLHRFQHDEQEAIDRLWDENCLDGVTKVEVVDGEFRGLMGYYTIVPEGRVRASLDRLGAELLVP